VIDAILASLAFPQMFDRRGNIEAPHRQTCQWILDCDKYKQWRSQSSGLLWIKGNPGAGKSTLMSFLYGHICDKRSGDKIYLDFFFSARGSELQRTPLGMLRSLLNQILGQDSSVRHLVEGIYNEKYAAFGRGHHDWHWQRRELEVLLADTILESAQTQPVEIFIDAIDEAGDQSARDMARYFHNINDRSTKSSAVVKICISCRHYPVVSQIPGIEIHVEDHNSDDISSFIRDRLRMDAQYNSDTAAFDLFVEDLVLKARDVFQWASLAVSMVEKLVSDGGSLAAIQRELQQVPQELSDVYRYILNDVINERYRVRSLHLFQWVCLAKRPLSMMEIQDALAAQDRVA
jgi:hypothetical protein